MKHTKKKRRSRASKQVGCNNDNTDLPNGDKGSSDLPEGEKEERGVLNCLVEAFDSASLEEAAVTFQKAEGDAHKAAVILGGLQEDSSDQTRSSCSSLCGSSASSSSSSEVFVRTNCGHDGLGRKGSGGSKSKKVVATTGMVSSVLGKNYLMSSPRRDSSKQKWCSERSASKEDKEQFLCSMLGDECELSMAVVQDVLCQCGYEVEKALNMLLELSACSYEQSTNSQSCGGSTNNKEDSLQREFSDNLTSKASDSTSHSSKSDLQDNLWSMGYHCRNYSDILAGSEFHCPSSPGAPGSDLLPQMVLESLFNAPKTSEHEPSTMNWRNVVKKMESLGQKFEFPPSCTEELQQFIPAKGDEYQVFRKAAKQHWDSMKSYYQKAASAYLNGEREYATYLSEQGRLSNKMAREADEKASQEIFRARNKSIENVITIDLHGQHVKQAMRLLKLHLLFGAYGRSVQSFRVITGCGSHGVGKSKLKQSVISLIESEGIEWHEENRGTVLIRLNGHREFSFLDAESDSE